MAEFASKGVGNAGLALGIIGSAGWLLGNSGGGNGLLGGLFGNRGNCNGNGQAELVSAYQATTATLAAEKYADSIGMELYREIIAQTNRSDQRLGDYSDKLAQGLISLDKKVAMLEASQPLLAEISTLKSERYSDAHTWNKVDGELRLPYKEICYPLMPQAAMPVPYPYGCGNGYNTGCGSTTFVQ